MNRFLSLSIETPVLRYIEMPQRIQSLTVELPLRILIMVSSPIDYPPLDVAKELGNLEQALSPLAQKGSMVVELLERATLPALQHHLQSATVHIFHFIGHGGFDASTQDGVLLFEDSQRHGRKLSGQYLGTILHNHSSLRLAVLNACEGARTSIHDPFAGVAQTLVQQNIPAVVAMQFEITDDAAITFSRELYSALANGSSVDAALVAARAMIFSQGNDIEWGTPVFFTRAPDGNIFNIQQPRLAETKSKETPLERKDAAASLPDIPAERPPARPSATSRQVSVQKLPEATPKEGSVLKNIGGSIVLLAIILLGLYMMLAAFSQGVNFITLIQIIFGLAVVGFSVNRMFRLLKD